MGIIISGFILGILGSMHCLGMCGPIALAIPHPSRNKLSMFADSVIYSGGRVMTYTILGLMFGAIGGTIKLAGYQQFLSIITGVGVLVVYFFPSGLKAKLKLDRFSFGFSNKLRSYFRKLFMLKTKNSLFGIGLLNGLLPCGLVYVALAGATANAGFIAGSSYMLAFGIGTMPMLTALNFSKSVVSPNIRLKITRLIPVGVALVGVILILRGLSLGIPFVSPVLHNMEVAPPCCR